MDAENIRRSVWPNIPEQRLVEMCAAWAERHRRRLVLVFDSHAPEGRAACETVAARNADDWITAAAGLDDYWLVTSDRELRRRAGERAVRLIGGGSFVHELLKR